MLLKDVLAVANQVYKLSGGTRKILQSLVDVSDINLPKEIFKAQQHKDIGVQLTKNIVDVLVCLVQVQKLGLDYSDACAYIHKLAAEQDKVFNGTWLVAYDVNLKTTYKAYIETALKFCELHKQNIDEKSARQVSLVEQNAELQFQLEKSKIENMALSLKLAQLSKDVQDQEANLGAKCSQLEKQNKDYKAFFAMKKEALIPKTTLEDLSDLIIADWSLEKSYQEITKLLAENEALTKVCKEDLEHFFAKSRDFYAQNLFNLHSATYKDLKALEGKVNATIALITVYSYNHSKRDTGFLKSKTKLTPPHTPTGKSLSHQTLAAKITYFCNEVLKRISHREDGRLAELALYLREPALTKKLVLEYSKNRMDYPRIAMQALDEKNLGASVCVLK